MTEQPTIVCLCGSTRFGEAFRAANLRETLAGRIVLSIGCDFKSDDALGLTDGDKARMDELHLRKIDLANTVLILNVGGYVGTSTAGELAYARSLHKPVEFWEYEPGTVSPLLDEGSVLRIFGALLLLEKQGKLVTQ
jgi:hypothetical protein